MVVRLLAVLLLLTTAHLFAQICFAEQLSVKTYSTGEGLPRDEVTLLRQDSRGFLWLAAGDGISRFDGYKFTNYTTNDGLADRRVNDLLETRGGIYLVATSAGLCRFNPIARPRSFTVLNPDPNKPTVFNALVEHPNGSIWAATDNGLYKVELQPDGTALFQKLTLKTIAGESDPNLTAVRFDRNGVLWCGTSVGTLFRLLTDGRVEQYSLKTVAAVNVLLLDRDERIWAGTLNGLYRLVAKPIPAQSVIDETYGTKEGLVDLWINALVQTHDGILWIGTSRGLYSFSPGSTAPDFQRYGAEKGLCDSDVWGTAEDRTGNLWLATRCGVQRIARNGFTTFGTSDGLGSALVNSIFENPAGTLFVVNGVSIGGTAAYAGRTINRFDGSRFTKVEPTPIARGRSHGWGWLQTVLQDHLGEWWIPTGSGLFRYPKQIGFEDLATARPRAFGSTRDKLGESEIFRLYEDRSGDIWIAVTQPHQELWRWQRSTDKLRNYTKATSTPSGTEFTAFAEDRAGNLWIGTSEAGLLRYSNGQFRRFGDDDGIPNGWIICLLVDQAGRLWAGSQLGGLNRIDDTNSNTLNVTRYTTANGLSSDNIRSLTDDHWGRIYVGTGHGVDRLNIETGNVKHYTVADGLIKGKIEVALRDRNNALWFGSWFGLSRLIPEQVDSRAPPFVFLTGLRVSGNPRDVSQPGEINSPRLSLGSGDHNLSIDFVGLGSTIGEELSYQYRLQGKETEWSAPTTERTINFANLAAGQYQFEVRATNSDGMSSLNPATIQFEIAAPIWKRWWFTSLVVGLITLTMYTVYRSRLNRLVELERIRTRIATDLHDDVGSGLSQVSILSEVIRRRGDHNEGVAEQLLTIGVLSRDLVDSMSDIVWAINPATDRLSDLSHRMRRFASDVLVAQGVKLTFEVSLAGNDFRLKPEMRRELYLIFKEAVNNAARHSRCTEVKVSLTVTGSALGLLVQDNGVGFEVESENDGNGLSNMRLRADKLGGELRIRVTKGTSMSLVVPNDGRRWFRFRRRVS